MSPDDFMEFIEVVAEFGMMFRRLTDTEVKELVTHRFKFESDHQGFFESLNQLASSNSDPLNMWLKFRQIYARLYRCIALGHKEIFDAFEIDMAHIACQIKIKEFSYLPDLTADDYINILKMTREQFSDLMQARKIEKNPEVFNISDKDGEGNVIYY